MYNTNMLSLSTVYYFPGAGSGIGEAGELGDIGMGIVTEML